MQEGQEERPEIPSEREATRPGIGLDAEKRVVSRYNSISRKLWTDGGMSVLGPPACSPAALYLYLLTCDRHSPVAGLLALGPGAIVDVTGWDHRNVSDGLAALETRGLLVRSQHPPMIFVPEAVETAPPDPGKVLSGWLASLDEMPDCEPVRAARKALGSPFEGSSKGHRRVIEGSSKGHRNQEQEQEQEQEQGSSSSPTPPPPPSPQPVAPRRRRQQEEDEQQQQQQQQPAPPSAPPCFRPLQPRQPSIPTSAEQARAQEILLARRRALATLNSEAPPEPAPQRVAEALDPPGPPDGLDEPDVASPPDLNRWDWHSAWTSLGGRGVSPPPAQIPRWAGLAEWASESPDHAAEADRLVAEAAAKERPLSWLLACLDDDGRPKPAPARTSRKGHNGQHGGLPAGVDVVVPAPTVHEGGLGRPERMGDHEYRVALRRVLWARLELHHETHGLGPITGNETVEEMMATLGIRGAQA